MAGKVKTWIWVIVTLLVICILCVVAMAGAGFYFFKQHIYTQEVTAVTANAQFERARAQFTGQKPLIELDERGQFLRSNPDRPPRADRKIPADIFVLAYDPKDTRIVRVRIPFWLLRFKPNARVDFNGGRLDLDDLKLTVEDLERFGPTLIVDHQDRGGDRVLVWSQ